MRFADGLGFVHCDDLESGLCGCGSVLGAYSSFNPMRRASTIFPARNHLAASGAATRDATRYPS
jgi:hypothetical protein